MKFDHEVAQHVRHLRAIGPHRPEWIGAPFKVEVMARGDNRAPAYLALNPSGQVPALQLKDGTILTEAAAILPFSPGACPQRGSAAAIARSGVTGWRSCLVF